MQGVGQRLGIGIVLLVELHRVPARRTPPLPVLDDDVQRQAALLELAGVGDDFLRRVVALAAVDVAEHPVRHLGDGPRQGAVRADGLVGLAGEHRVVQRRGDGGTEGGRVLDLLPIEDRVVGADALDRKGMRAGGQGNKRRGGRRQPGVGHVHHGLPVDGKVVPARHLLAHVQQEGIGPVLGNVDAAGE